MPSTDKQQSYIDVLRYRIEELTDQRSEINKQISDLEDKMEIERRILNLIKE